MPNRRARFAHARHELRTPLNAILGYSELLLEDADALEDALGRPVTVDLETIHRNGRALLGLIDATFEPESLARRPERDAHDFPAQVSHALRTPLTTVVGIVELLLEEAGESAFVGRNELLRVLNASHHLVWVIEEAVRLLEQGVPDGPERSEDQSPVRRPKEDRHAVGRLLVVDDHETNRDLLSRRLRRYGHSVMTAQDGVEALAMVRANEFDIVLLDVMMPGLDGYETLKAFKSDPGLRDIPVVMISALDEMDSVARCIEQGAEDYLPKTFDPILLQARIAACLEKKAFRDREKLYLTQIETEKRRADELLRVILPEPIIQELQSTNTVKPRRYDNVAVLFCDVVGFTPYCSLHPPEDVIADLQEMIEHFEQIALRFGVQKIKTVGDSFMGTAGLITEVDDPVRSCIECGLEMVEAASRLASGWEVRVGIHDGPVVAGVVGRRQYLFDLWGDTVNTAARVESHGANGAVNVSVQTWGRIAEQYFGVSLGVQTIKGKGNLEIYRISRHPILETDADPQI